MVTLVRNTLGYFNAFILHTGKKQDSEGDLFRDVLKVGGKFEMRAQAFGFWLYLWHLGRLQLLSIAADKHKTEVNVWPSDWVSSLLCPHTSSECQGSRPSPASDPSFSGRLQEVGCLLLL